jgi:Ribonuclease G/E
MEKPSTIQELAMSERKFLHDIANHIVVAHGMSTFVLRAMREKRPLEEKDLDRLERAVEAINKMTALLKERRTVLHELTE